MLRGKIIRNFSILILCLIIIEILRIYPTQKQVSESVSINKGIIYMLDDNNFLSRLDVVYNAKDDTEVIKEIIELLTITDNNDHIRKGFNPIIPKGTKLLSVSVTDSNATLDFSRNFLDIEENLEEKMIEALVYSITEIENIASITIKVDHVLLQKLPHSLKKVPSIIDRTYKINKVYDIDSLNEVNSTTIYFPALNSGYKYYIPVTKYENSNKEKIEIIIDELESSNTYNSNIVNYINSEAKLINYELLDKSILLNFNDAIFGDIASNNIIEEVLYSINLSVKDSYDDVDAVMYYVKDNLIGTHFLLRG